MAGLLSMERAQGWAGRRRQALTWVKKARARGCEDRPTGGEAMARTAARINRAWHESHRMPSNAGDDERIAWHLDHARHCGCRRIDGGVAALFKKRGIAIPEPPTAQKKNPADK
jgi:hypothetical protein